MAVQRAVATWGGTWDTSKYETNKYGGREEGVEIDLIFRPGRSANATKIALIQMVNSINNGSVVALSPTVGARSIPAGKSGAGSHIDQMSDTNSPIYYADYGSTSASLTGTPTVSGAGGGRHGFRFVDANGKTKTRSALLNDKPRLPGRGNNASQIFETTALAIAGVQQGTYYGSVQWGWQTDASGTFTRLPLTQKSFGSTTGTFDRAARQWNKTKSSTGARPVRLPRVSTRWTAADAVPIVDDPAAGEGTGGARLPRNVRVQVIDTGADQDFNTPTPTWWKVTLISGAERGRVGWIRISHLATRRS